MKSGQLCSHRQSREYEVSVQSGGLNRPPVPDMFTEPLCLQSKEAPPLWEQGGHLPCEDFTTCFREEGQSDLPAFVVFSVKRKVN